MSAPPPQEGVPSQGEPREDGDTCSVLRATWEGGLREALPEPERPRSTPAPASDRPGHMRVFEAGYGAWARRRFGSLDELRDRMAGEGDTERTSPRPPPYEGVAPLHLPTIRGSTDEQPPSLPPLWPPPGAGADGAR